jgi:hypothetical protein
MEMDDRTYWLLIISLIIMILIFYVALKHYEKYLINADSQFTQNLVSSYSSNAGMCQPKAAEFYKPNINIFQFVAICKT